MAKKKTVAQRQAYRYSGNPDDMPEENRDKSMASVPTEPVFVPSRRSVVKGADVMPQRYSPAAPSEAVDEGVIDKMHLPSVNHEPGVKPRRYNSEAQSGAVDEGVYDAGAMRAMNHAPDVIPQRYGSEAPSGTVYPGGYDALHNRAANSEVDVMPSPSKKDVPMGGASAQVANPSTGAPNIFTSGGVRGAFEPEPESAYRFTPVNWEEEGRRQAIGWTPEGKPVYEWNGYEEDKRPPLMTATEQAYDPMLKGKPGEIDESRRPVFEKDPEKKDGGFMKWLGGLFKPRKGKREGETDDEYDERMTRNQMRIMTIANALRHMANLYYTSKGGLPQQFNDPNAELRNDFEKRKAERAQKTALAVQRAEKEAQLQLQRDKAEADKYYKNMLLYYKGRDADRADDRFRWDKDKDKWNRDRLSSNDSWKQGFEERKQKATEGYQRGRLAIEGKKAKAAMLRATGGRGGGSIGNTVNLATPKGHLNRKKELSVLEENQIFNFLRKNGNITSDYIAGWGSLTPDEKRAKIQSAIAYAASTPGKRGDKVRKYLKEHHGYTEAATSAVGGLDFN